jgi:glutathione S-transferase
MRILAAREQTSCAAKLPRASDESHGTLPHSGQNVAVRLDPLIVYHIPVCPFSQRLEVLLALKKKEDAVEFRVVDITKPREPWLLEKTNGSTSLPVLETDHGVILRESLVLLQYLDDTVAIPIAQRDPLRRAVENMFSSMERDFVAAGYRLVMNRDPKKRDDLTARMDAHYGALNAFLEQHSKDGTFLFEEFGWAEVVYTSMFMRFWFLDYYEGYDIPNELARVRRYRDGCVEHPAAQQVTREEIIKVYYDYAKGAGNGALVEGRARSSFVFEPHWSKRPWPPRDKYLTSATDADLGLLTEPV